MTTPPPAFYKQACEILEAATLSAYAAQREAAEAWDAHNSGSLSFEDAWAIQERTDVAWDKQREAGDAYSAAYRKWSSMHAA